MSKEVFTPEKLRELAMELREKTIPSGYEAVITEWLEQNPIEPVFVGLTDEQVTQFIEKYNIHPLIGVHLKDWQKTQTFAQPEVKEVVVGLSEDQINELHDAIHRNEYNQVGEYLPYNDVVRNYLKTQTFAHPEAKEVVVVLSDEQLEDLVKGLSIATTDYQFKKRLDFAREWLDAQTFAKPDVGISDTSPNWDAAPCWANWLAQDETGDWFYFEKKPTAGEDGWMHNNGTYESTYAFVKNWQQTLQQRPNESTKEYINEIMQDFGIGNYRFENLVRITKGGKYQKHLERIMPLNDLLASWKDDLDEIKADLYVKGEKGDSLHYNLLSTEALILATCIADLQNVLLQSKAI